MGWQYQMPAYRLALERMGIAQSMSRKGNCLDNAKAENFFSMVKTELYCDWEGDDSDIFERDLEKYIDWYNNVRIKRRLDGSSPVEYRLSRALDSLLLPFRKRGPLQFWGAVHSCLLASPCPC